jgi:hypothetical protein
MWLLLMKVSIRAYDTADYNQVVALFIPDQSGARA